MTNTRSVRTVIERGLKGKRSVAFGHRLAHSAYHTLDHAWEMEDKDLTAQDGAVVCQSI
jgi:hypothetical protein